MMNRRPTDFKKGRRQSMPRPKGSKNKPAVVLENLDEKIAAAEAEIVKMSAELKTKKIELKRLMKAKAEADRAAEERRAEEQKKVILDAVEKSGKSLEEILELLK